MLLKFSGMALLCIGGALFGGYKALALSRRVAVLGGLYEAITVFKSEISFMTAEMETALESASARDKSGIFKESLGCLFEKGASEAMSDAVKLSSMPPEEKEILLSFSKGLSGRDKESQMKNADMALMRIEKLQEKASENQEKLSSLYCTIGILGGAAGGILLL